MEITISSSILGGGVKSGSPEAGIQEDAPEWLKECFKAIAFNDSV
jgi:hypothetical protein